MSSSQSRMAGVLALFLTSSAWAALGGDYDSVRLDSQNFRAALSSTATQQYDVHLISSGPNSTVREYLSNGKVFAVTWQSRGMPNLRQLLGPYFERYVASANAALRPGTHDHLTVARDDLVVHSFGRPRSFHGTAYIPALVPAGISPSDLN